MVLFVALLPELAQSALASRAAERPDLGGGRPQEGAHPLVAADDERACAACHREVTAHREMHGPTAAGACLSCHTPIESGGRQTMKLTHGGRAGDTGRLCLQCHEEIGNRMRDARLHAPVAAGGCVACHDPHGTAFRFQLPAEGNAACLQCHVDVAQALAQRFRHAPAEASCAICHDAHAAKFPSQLRGPVNSVCLACHFNLPKGAVADSAALFGRAIGTHEHLIEKGPRIVLDRSLRSGHPSIGHPIEGPEDPLRKGQPLNCTSCHNPHGTSSRKLMRFEATGISSLCIRCHAL
jgi:predicted CXXCH cytochrome family protein